MRWFRKHVVTNFQGVNDTEPGAVATGCCAQRCDANGANGVLQNLKTTRHLYLLDQSGRPAALAQSVELDFSLSSANIGPIQRQPSVAGPGHYLLDSNDLTIAGTWTILVRAQVSKFEENTATFTVNVNP